MLLLESEKKHAELVVLDADLAGATKPLFSKSIPGSSF